MKKNTSDNLKWVVPVILIVTALVIAVALKNNEMPYDISAQEAVVEAGKAENSVHPLDGILTQDKIVLIDVRDPQSYNLNHPKNAVNFPSQTILMEDNINALEEIIKNGNTLVLFGTDPRMASGSWLLLRQIGLKNIKYFNGTFEQLVSSDLNALNLKNENPLIDTSLLKSAEKQETNINPQSKPKKVEPMRSAPAREAGGGC